jgi:beta-exotoxin I transport system permease protein
MRTDIVRLDVSGRWRSLVGYSAGMALYALVVVALYPAFKGSTSLDNLVKADSTAAALFGVSGSLTSSGGWLNANIWANFFPLIMLLMTIGYGASSIAGQDEDGTLGLVASLPVRRIVILLQKVAAMALQALVLAASVGACVIVGRSFQLTISVVDTVAVSVALLLMGVDFGLTAMAVGASTGRRGSAVGVTAAIAAASYLVSSLAPVISWIGPARYASLFYWSVGNNQITDGVTIADLAVLIIVGLCALGAAVLTFRRLDIH